MIIPHSNIVLSIICTIIVLFHINYHSVSFVEQQSLSNLFLTSYLFTDAALVSSSSAISSTSGLVGGERPVKFGGPKFSYPKQFFEAYRTLDEIAGYMKYLSITRTRASVQLLKIGYSYEGRAIRALKVTGRNRLRPKQGNSRKYPKTRGILITAGVHGREWVTPAATLYAISRILESYGMPGNESLTEMLDACTLHIIPIVNPDGYRFTWRNNGALQLARFRLGTHTGTKKPKPAPLSRLWRGNRRKLDKGQIGVDLNRNWGSPGLNWGKGVSNIKSINYQGKSGFSEPETQTVRTYAMNRMDINLFLDVHCCIKSIRAPFSMEPYNDTMANEYARVGQAMVEAMTEAKGRLHKYTFRPKERRKFDSGISTGWALTELGIGNSFTIELGGKFISPVRQIKIDGEELLAAILVAMAEATTTNKMLEEHAVVPGSFGDLVFAWQKFLRAGGYFPKGVGPGRFFGPICTKATIRWQEIHNITTNGYFDIPTQKRAKTGPTYTVTGEINKNVFSYQPKPLSRPARSQVVGEKLMSKLTKYAAGKRMDAGSTNDDYGESNEEDEGNDNRSSNEDNYSEEKDSEKQKMDKTGLSLHDSLEVSQVLINSKESKSSYATRDSSNQGDDLIIEEATKSIAKPVTSVEQLESEEVTSEIPNKDELENIVEFNKKDEAVEKELIKLAILAEKEDINFSESTDDEAIADDDDNAYEQRYNAIVGNKWVSFQRFQLITAVFMFGLYMFVFSKRYPTLRIGSFAIAVRDIAIYILVITIAALIAPILMRK